MADDTISGGIERAGLTRLEGWCWSTARPNTALTVEILLDDTPVATLLAGQFRRDLARNGIGDGRHAFVFDLPDRGGLTGTHLDRAGMIDLREAASGRIVGRVRQRGPRETLAATERIDRLLASLAPLRAAAAAPPATGRADELRAAFEALGDHLAAAAQGDPGPIGGAWAELARLLPPVALPFVAAPRLTVALAAADALSAGHAAMSFAPTLRALEAEMLLADDGSDPRTALLAAVIAHLGLVRLDGTGFAAFGNAAAAAARAPMLALLAGDFSARATSHGLAECIGAGEDEVVAGPAVLAAAARAGWGDRLAAAPIAGDGTTGLLVGIGSALFRRLGGLDPGLAADSGLCALDLCLKAMLDGRRIMAFPPPWPPDPAPHTPAAEAAARHFRRRWQ